MTKIIGIKNTERINADSFDHVCWREVSDHSAIAVNTGAFISNTKDKYLKRY